MAYKLHNTRYRSQNHGWLWFSAKILLSLLLLNVLGFVLKLDVFLLISANAFVSVLIFALVKLNHKNQKLPYIMIQDSKLEYFCPDKNEIITVYAHEITNITTRFFELRIHTNDQVHSINLELISDKRTRWELKEMIRELANSNTTLRVAAAN